MQRSCLTFILGLEHACRPPPDYSGRTPTSPIGSTSAQPSSPKAPSGRASTTADSIAAWTAAEKESFLRQMAGFSELHELARQNVATFEEVRKLIPEHGDSSFARTQDVGNSLFCQESLEELENLVKMAKVFQELAVSFAAFSAKLR